MTKKAAANAGYRDALVTPSAARLTESLRDIGYDFPAAVADIVDNSIAAGAQTVEVDIEPDGAASRVSIADDGDGMSANGLLEALRFGSRRDYRQGDLGRYGLGLKTASLSQCRSLTVVTRNSRSVNPIARRLDLDLIAELDDWLITAPPQRQIPDSALLRLAEGTGTVIVWEQLDRILQSRPDSGWTRRRLESLVPRTAEHLSMVFHRQLERPADEGGLVILVNGTKLEPWNPFAPAEPGRELLPEQRFEISVGDVTGAVRLSRVVLPAKDRFSRPGEWDRLSGPRRWNRQQGLYVYRADRLVQWGGWAGLRGIDEHLKLARAALDFDTDLDPAFNINVAKMRVTIPIQLRQMLERPVHELCLAAESAYRGAGGRGRPIPGPPGPDRRDQDSGTAGLALRAAAMRAGEYPAFQRIVDVLATSAPEVHAALGFATNRASKGSPAG